MRAENKKPLYRKVNTKARGVHHRRGGDYKNTRNRDSAIGMRQGVQRGLDYTPLFKFLLSKIGGSWNEIHSEAVSRLDKEDPVFLLVAKNSETAYGAVRVGESAYYSGLFVDENEILCVVSPELNEESLTPLCKCCTHTFNGIAFTRAFDGEP